MHEASPLTSSDVSPDVPIDLQRTAGFTLIELTVSLAIAGLAAAVAVGGLRTLVRAATLEQARLRLTLALLEARRSAYTSGGTAGVFIESDGRQLIIRRGDGAVTTVSLPAEVAVVAAPLRASVRFYASGLADNATIELATANGERATVVVNQRGMIR